MTDWPILDREWVATPPTAPYATYHYAEYYPYYQEMSQQLPPPYFAPPPPLAQTLSLSSAHRQDPPPLPVFHTPPIPKGDNPREIRNKAEKQRRANLNQSIAELASIVPPVVAANRKIDKTGVLRLTAHYLRAHQHVFGDSVSRNAEFKSSSTLALLSLLNGFLLTTTYKGVVVVVSQNVNEYLGYSEVDLLGVNIFNLTHKDDRQILKHQLMPRSQKLGPNGELIVPEDVGGRQRVAHALASERRSFIVRFKKLGQRSEPCKYLTCHVEGSLRKSDRACRGFNHCCQMVRRARARCDNPCSGGNDVVFIGIVRPSTETFLNETAMESYNMEYRTRHSIDGEIIQCEQRIALVTGYMIHEVYGVNAMNFIHRDEVRWVIVALREMYDQNLMYGESCYRLITKNSQLIYMRTRGRLDVDKDSKAVTSFICTNTVVDEEDGKQLIKMMKQRFTLSAYNKDVTPSIEDATTSEHAVPVEDPRQLEEVILQMVTNLPSTESTENPPSVSTDRGESQPRRLAIIPPKKERIVSAIEKIYTVIKTIPKPSIFQKASVAPTPMSSTLQDATLAPSFKRNILQQATLAQPPMPSIDQEAKFSPPTMLSMDQEPDSAPPLMPSIQHEAKFSPPPMPSIQQEAEFSPLPMPSIQQKAEFAPSPMPNMDQELEFESEFEPEFEVFPMPSLHPEPDFEPFILPSNHQEAGFEPFPMPIIHQEGGFDSFPMPSILQEPEFASSLMPNIDHVAGFETFPMPSIDHVAGFETFPMPSIDHVAGFETFPMPSIHQEAGFAPSAMPSNHQEAAFAPSTMPSILQDAVFAPSANPTNFIRVYTENQSQMVNSVKCSQVTGTTSDFEYARSTYVSSSTHSKYSQQTKYLEISPQGVDQSCQYPDVKTAGPSTGLKRAKAFDQEEEISFKKKVNEMIIENREANGEAGFDSKSLELFFDEALLNSQIESAIETLEQNIDPNFPDLLISQELQEILGVMEEPQDDLAN